MNIRPLHDNVLIRRDEENKTSTGGIVLSDHDKEKPMQGRVIAVGAGKREDGRVIALDVNVGDQVLFSQYSGTELKITKEKLLMIKENDIMAIIE
jgi:chaperonin GroES